MDQLSYDIGRLMSTWKSQLSTARDDTADKRAYRRAFIQCINDLEAVIKNNIQKE